MSRRYLLRRLAQIPLSVLAVVAITFSLVHFLPGDPAYSMAGENASPEQVEQVRRAYGFDRPVPVQFARYVSRVARGDLGYSYSQGMPVARVIRNYARPTLLLTGTALLFSTAVGTLLAVLMVRRPFRLFDQAVNAVMVVVYAIPGYWIAQLAIMYLVLKLRLFPLAGYSEVGSRAPTGLRHLADVGRHLALPVLVLAVTEIAAVTRMLRSRLLLELGQGYVRTATGKGLAPNLVLSEHALRNAMLPAVNLIGARVGFLLSGAAIIESIFAWPGLGSLLVTAVEVKDRQLMIGMALVVSMAVVAANLATDLVCRWIDPRIRYD